MIVVSNPAAYLAVARCLSAMWERGSNAPAWHAAAVDLASQLGQPVAPRMYYVTTGGQVTP